MPKSAILLKLITEQKCRYMPCLLLCRSQRAVWLPTIFLSPYCLCIPHCFHHSSRTLGLLGGFQPYIWPQMPFTSQNHINNNLLSVFAYIVSSRYQVFDPRMTTIFTPHQVACSRGFDRQKWDIEDVRDICERAGRSWVGFGTLPLIGARLGFQTLEVVRGRMGFQTLSN